MDQKKNPLSRRDFIRAATLAGAGCLLPAARAAAAKDAASKPAQVPTRPFGKTGRQVASLSLGGMFDIPSNQLLLHQALSMGVTYWDTAHSYGYGRSEEGIGMFLARNPSARQKIFLVTKSTERDPSGMAAELDTSLKRLHTDYVDLFFMHGISSISEVNDQYRALTEKLKAQGKIKLAGFSTHSNMADCLAGAAKLGWIDGIMFTYNYRLMHQEDMKQAVQACYQAGIGLTAMKTQGGGPVRMDSESELMMAGRFMRRGFTDKQAKLKAIWEDERIACICSQMPNLTILTANVAALGDLPNLSQADHQLLQAHAQQTACGYCAGCSSLCQEALAQAAPVGDIMRYLMYYRDYGERDLARELFASLPLAVRQDLGRLDYRPAERVCPQGLPIAKLMQEAGQILSA